MTQLWLLQRLLLAQQSDFCPSPLLCSSAAAIAAMVPPLEDVFKVGASALPLPSPGDHLQLTMVVLGMDPSPRHRCMLEDLWWFGTIRWSGAEFDDRVGSSCLNQAV